MMLRQYLITAALFLFLVSNASNTFANDDSQAQAVRKTVASYCDIEFDGAWVESRWAILKFSAKRKDDERYKEVTDAAVFELGEHYPFIVVTSYDIREIKILGPKRATAQAAYRRVAHSASKTGEGWYLVPDPMDNDLVTLNLILDKNKWFVLDPPPPRISRDWLIDYYDELSKEAAVNSPRWLRATKALTSLKAL